MTQGWWRNTVRWRNRDIQRQQQPKPWCHWWCQFIMTHTRLAVLAGVSVPWHRPGLQFLLVPVYCDTAQALVFLLASLYCDTAQTLVFLLASVYCDTAQALQFLLVSVCCDTAQDLVFLLVWVYSDAAQDLVFLLVSVYRDTDQAYSSCWCQCIVTQTRLTVLAGVSVLWHSPGLTALAGVSVLWHRGLDTLAGVSVLWHRGLGILAGVSVLWRSSGQGRALNRESDFCVIWWIWFLHDVTHTMAWAFSIM